MGGEKCRILSAGRKSQGSPPHGRGKDPQRGPEVAVGRITPAWAGKSSALRRSPAASGDHPRMGGEKTRNAPEAPKRRGSPPHGRGKEGEVYEWSCKARITPAWAGKRLKRSHRSGIFISGPIPFHSVLHRPAGSGGSRAGRDGSPAGQPQNAGPA